MSKDNFSPEDVRRKVAGLMMSNEDNTVGVHPENIRAGAWNMMDDVMNTINVRFRVVVSRDFHLDLVQDMVLIRFNSEELGGWHSDQWIMNCEKSLGKGYHLMNLTVPIPRRLLSAYKTIDYKYVIKREEYYVWEFINKRYYQGINPNRYFQLTPDELRSVVELDRCDALMYPAPSTAITKQIQHYFKGLTGQVYNKICEEMQMAVRVMLPTWDNLSASGNQITRTAESFVGEVDKVMKSSKRNFLNINGTGLDEQIYGNILVEFLQTAIDSFKGLNDRKEETLDEERRRLAVALSIVNLVQKDSIKLKRIAITPLVDALLLRAVANVTECLDYNEFMEYHFPNTKREMAEILEKFLLNVNFQDVKQHHWLYAVPLFHFLRGDSKPFESLEPSDKITQCEWWGTTGLVVAIEQYQLKLKHIPVKHVVDVLSPLFPVDPLLSRTLVASVGFSHLSDLLELTKVRPEIYLASLHVKITFNRMNQQDHEKLASILDQIAERILFKDTNIQLEQDTLTSEAQRKMAANIAGCLLKSICVHPCSRKQQQPVLSALKVFVAIVFDEELSSLPAENANLPIQNATRSSSIKDWLQPIVNSAANDVFTWLNEALYYSRVAVSIECELEIISELLAVKLPYSDVATPFEHSILAILETKIKNMAPRETLKFYCSHDFGNLHPAIEDCFSKSAFDAIETNQKHYEKEFHRFMDESGYNDTKKYHLISDLFVKTWQRSVHNEKSSEDILKHITVWTAFTRYVALSYRNSSRRMLKDDCLSRIQCGLSVFEQMLDKLVNGTIRLTNLETLCMQRVQVLELYGLIQAHSEVRNAHITDKEFLNRLICCRWAELEAFQRQREQLGNLVNICNGIKLVNSGLHEALESDLNQKGMGCMLSDVCKPIPLNPDGTYGLPKVVAFRLSQPVEEMVLRLDAVKESLVFLRLWNHFGNEVLEQKGKQLQLDEVVSDVWEPANAEYTELGENVTSGCLTLNQVDNMFRPYDGDYQIIHKELRCLCRSESTVRNRLNQIEQYHILDQYKRGAELMLDVKKQLGLRGDFSVLESMANAGQDKNDSLDMINENFLASGKYLSEITKEEQEAIRVFSKCTPLVDWLKKTTNGPKEVNVLVDLAMIYATGKGDMEVQKVSCLHAAVTGYASLIYDLDVNVDFQKFIDLCRPVWHALKADESLPGKLEDTNRNLKWLKDINRSHGDVEVNAPLQADAINSRGIFQIGNISEDTTKTVENSFSMQVPLEKDCKQHKKYTYSELNDLQSKLMLVAGKEETGRDNIDRFVEMFDGITRLANTYVKICAAGSILLQIWKATFYCNPENIVCVSVEIGLSKRKLQGCGIDLIKQLQDVGKFMEGCLDTWLDHIEKNRLKFSHLNFFTTAQLVLLRRELAKLAFTKESICLHIYPMLSYVNADCSESDLKKTIMLVLSKTEENDEKRSTQSPEEANADKCEAQQRAQFIRGMTESGYSQKLAEKALTEFSASELDIQTCIMWCMQHEDDEEDVEEMDSVQEDTDTGLHLGSGPLFNNDLHSLGYVAETLLNVASEGSTLKDQLGQLWEGYLNNVGGSISDCLSMEHLGMVLKELAVKGKKPIDRPLPGYLNHDKPNLIVCNESDTFHTVLYIYMEGEGNDLPLPRSDEVLFCSEETTSEEVGLLWRRAAEDQDGKIFCLIAADLLDYEVSQRVESDLEKYQHGNREYKLVVVCSHEREDSSHLVTVLDRFRVYHPMLETTASVQDYLHKHFTLQETGTMNKPAAFIDPEHVCVRLIKSHRTGVGKSHCVKRLREKMEQLNPDATDDKTPMYVKIPMQRKRVDVSAVLETLMSYTTEPNKLTPRLFHFDIGHNVQEGVDYLLFNLLVLGSLTDSSGVVWLRSPADMYVIENTPLVQSDVHSKKSEKTGANYVHHILALLPSITCWSPLDCLSILNNNRIEVTDKYIGAVIGKHDQMVDQDIKTPHFQRPYHYLKNLDERQFIKEFNSNEHDGNLKDCLEIFMTYCGLKDPSWSELRHFVIFLNTQLEACEQSIYCSSEVADDLPGFLLFVIKFMMQMSRDFATRSLAMSEETPSVENLCDELLGEQRNDQAIIPYIMKKRWETSPHPYVFFNSDCETLTFLGFFVNRLTGDIHDPLTKEILQSDVVPKRLQQGLYRNGVVLQEEDYSRLKKITKICSVMGIDFLNDPDNTYELTMDNVKKILAIYMRFRCGIPVVIMGETGCGKTRLIKFMCDLQKPCGVEMTNMVLMKVHGGTTENDIQRKVKEAESLAEKNQTLSNNVDTVLFFDEVNTTEAIGLIKEIMCDGTINGRPLQAIKGLKLIAACNPYRRHSDAMIRRLEQTGLGYHVQANQTRDKLGRIPMRQLVYRVQALPRSMLPLVWDFGQLNTEVEELYIQQMVLKCVGNAEEMKLPNTASISDVISSILAASQDFMRSQKDECSFVSLRDVERVMRVMLWFYKHRTLLYERIQKRQGKEDTQYKAPDDVTRALILALGVCYHSRLQNRLQYREHVAKKFRKPCSLPGGPNSILQEINWCQDVFLESVKLGKNIARNLALKENLFMMVVCIELRIPLFLVGKPGSSKSLAKTIVADAMQGDASHDPLFKAFKLVHMVSFQCSPLATPEGIIGTFCQCAKLQEEKDLNKFVSVVVLDEVGLAEDSPRMPLKTLHPLLEDGCVGGEKPQPHKKVAFIGISNWALDPAKMNRGIHVQREMPDENELVQSAIGICATDEIVKDRISKLMQPMSHAYLELYRSAMEIREFFGLRDFYGLVKMVYGFSKKSGADPTWLEIKHAILRNFGGLDTVKPLHVFEQKICGIDQTAKAKETDPKCDADSLIRSALEGDGLDSETRYLLILTENYSALSLLQQKLLKMKNTLIIFGSSFPRDQEYTQVCRNINRIKICMDTGKTVVLLNLENLYESLYDALNQYYVELGGDRFVDLGLGTQRVKCRVHRNFRLIVVAEKQVVYEKFPLPLINRLEKHILAMSTVLNPDQIRVVHKLEKWTEDFTSTNVIQLVPHRRVRLTAGDVFIGYNADTAASIVLHLCTELGVNGRPENEDSNILVEAQKILLQCCTPDAIIRLKESKLIESAEKLQNIYLDEQKHGNLLEFLQEELRGMKNKETIFAQVTTHSKLVSSESTKDIAKRLGISIKNAHLMPLQAIDTEQQFCKAMRCFFTTDAQHKDRFVLVQCDSGDTHGELIACSRHIILTEFSENEETINQVHHAKTLVVFIIQLPRVAGGCFSGFEGGRWKSFHIDELQTTQCSMLPIRDLQKAPVSNVFEPSDMCTLSVRLASQGCDGKLNRKEETVIETSKKLDIDRLISNCVHSTGSMLKDPEPRRQRKTHRVQLLKKLISVKVSCAQTSMCDVLKTRLYWLLKEKENTVMADEMATSWLQKEVASVEAVNKAGTLSRSLLYYLESKVTPLLAGMLAFMDTNNNLDILEKAIAEKNQHIVDIWLALMKSDNACVLPFRCFQSAIQRTDLTEFQVHSSGSEGTLFVAMCPFSWIIKTQIDVLVHRGLSPKKGIITYEDAELIDRLFMESPVGTVINTVLKDKADLTNRYLHDYIHMVYKPHSEETADLEYTFVTNAVYSAAREYHISDYQNLAEENNPFTLTIPGIHVTYVRVQKRLQLFIQVVQLWPQCVRKLVQFAEKDNVLCTDTEMSLRSLKPSNYIEIESLQTYMSLHYEKLTIKESKGVQARLTLDVQVIKNVLEYLTPTKNLLDDVDNREEWSSRVEKLLPIIDVIFTGGNNNGLGNSQFGMKCVEEIDKLRPTWTTVRVILLFVKHTCPTASLEANLSVKKIMPLWTMLKKDADFKKAKSLETVENFLKLCNKTACTYFFGKENICQRCQNSMVNHVELPCEHVLCHDCVLEMKQLGDNSCHECREKIPENFEPVVSEKNKKALDGRNDYKQRCNVFYAELVKSLCFSGNAPPDTVVIRKLLHHVTREKQESESGKPITKTKKFTVFDDGIDPTPVVRSFILQLLLRSRIDDVRHYLQEYLMRSKSVLTEKDDLIELSILIVHCLEDYFSTQASRMVHSEELQNAAELLIQALGYFKSEECGIEKIEAIAMSRYSLNLLANWMQKTYIEGGNTRPDESKINNVLKAAENLCNQATFEWPRLYLMRLLSRKYGVECLRTVGGIPRLKWVLPPEARANKNDAVPDRYLICGEAYKTLRDALAESILGINRTAFTDVLKKTKENDDWNERMLLLALHSEVTMAFSRAEEKPHQKVGDSLLRTFQKEKAVQDLVMVQQLVSNSFGQLIPCLNITPNTSRMNCDIIELVVHYTLAVRSSRMHGLLRPFLAIMNKPETMINDLFPTMHEDNLLEMCEVVFASRTFRHDAQTLYTCPNGHPYLIGDCGRPWSEGKCPDCGADIGGKLHKELPGNEKMLNAKDRTATGHILGRPEQRPKDPMPERDLSPATTTIMRLLLHMAMLVGTNQHLKTMANLIHPEIPPEQVGDFLWAHTECDLDLLNKALGRSRDDTLLLLHLIMEHVAVFKGKQTEAADLRSKKSRREWENRFADAYIIPYVNNVDSQVKQANRLLLGDSRLENSLLRSLYEMDTSSDPLHSASIEVEPAMWRYRPKITIEHIKQKFNETCRQNSMQGEEILQLFLNEEYQLRFLRFLPNILKLQRFLIERYHRIIDSSEAIDLRVKDMLKEIENENKRKEVEKWIQSYATTWDFVRMRLTTINLRGVRMPSELCDKRVTQDASIAVLLPSWKGEGICGLAVVRFLVDLQNSFVERYAALRGRSVNAVVKAGDVSLSHTVAYHPDQDLLPLVLSNCNYSLSMGSEVEIEYDFQSLGSQVAERYISGRPRIDYQYDVVVFREDYSNAVVFKELRNRIPQVCLPQAIQKQLQSIKHHTELTENLAKIDVCIGFLVSVGGDPERKLVDFMNDTLKMETGILSIQARQCRLKQVESLWLVMSHEKAKLLALNGQDPFDAVEDKYLEEIPQEQADAIRRILFKLNVEVFLYQLFEALLLQLTIKCNKEDEDFTDNIDFPLREALAAFIDDRGGIVIPSLLDERFPDTILVKHAIATWRMALDVYIIHAKERSETF